MRLAAAGDPVEHEVRRGHKDDVAGVRVEGILAGAEGPFPDATLAFGHALTVPERVAGQVAAETAIIADHDADVADRHDGFRDHFHRGEPAVNEIPAIR